MTKEETLNYNKLCAEFLGYKFSQTYEHYDEYYNVWENDDDGIWYNTNFSTHESPK